MVKVFFLFSLSSSAPRIILLVSLIQANVKNDISLTYKLPSNSFRLCALFFFYCLYSSTTPLYSSFALFTPSSVSRGNSVLGSTAAASPIPSSQLLCFSIGLLLIRGSCCLVAPRREHDQQQSQGATSTPPSYRKHALASECCELQRAK